MSKKAYTLTVHKGNFKNYNRAHNVRKKDLIEKELDKDMRLYSEPHIDLTKKGKNIILCDKNPEKLYASIFDTPQANGKTIIEEWNEKQEKNRNYDLKYENAKAYYDDLKKKAGKSNVAPNPVVELIIQFGNYDERPNEIIAEKMYRQFYNDFNKKYSKHFKVCGAYVHFDEVGGHHMHLDVIPVGDRDNNRGMLKKISFEVAARQTLGLPKSYRSKNAAEAPTFLFCEHLRQDIAKMYEQEGFIAERYINQNNHHISTPQFKLKKRAETYKKLVDDYTIQSNELIVKIKHFEDIINNQKQEISNNKDELENQRNLIIDIRTTYDEVVESKTKLKEMAEDILKNVETIPEIQETMERGVEQIAEIDLPSSNYIDELIDDYEEVANNKIEIR